MVFQLEKQHKNLDNFETSINLTIENILSGYPNTEELGESFKTEIEKLKRHIKSIKIGNFEGKENFTEIKYKKEHDAYFIMNKKEFGALITVGDIVSGLEWGKKYYLNYDSFKENGKIEFYNQYMQSFLEKATTEILNRHIVRYETEDKKGTNGNRENAYKGIAESMNTPVENLPLGPKAEKIVRAFLTRLSFNNPDFEFEVIETNAFQDIVFKIDLIIKSKKGLTGVKTQNTDIDDTIIFKRIQLTTETSHEKLLLKKTQTENLDVTLIEIPDVQIGQAFNEWIKSKDQIHGPEWYLNNNSKKMILEKILTDIVPNDILAKELKRLN